MATKQRTVGIVLFEDVDELDVVGPWEVLTTWTQACPGDGWRVVTLSHEGGMVRCLKGLRIMVDHAQATCPPLDVLVYPGGDGTRRQLARPEELERLRVQAASGTLLTSVCTGALVYAAAGLLSGRPATTHWTALDEMAALDPSIALRDDRYVDDGDVVTAAGVSAGIDMALHLVRRLAGEERASDVRREMQYEPLPPVPNPST